MCQISKKSYEMMSGIIQNLNVIDNGSVFLFLTGFKDPLEDLDGCVLCMVSSLFSELVDFYLFYFKFGWVPIVL